MKFANIFMAGCVAMFFCSTRNAEAQEVKFIEELLAYKTPASLSFPFSTIQVIDARFDTSYIYIPSNNKYPVDRVQFSSPLTRVVARYFDSSLVSTNRGNRHLLVRIESFSVPNIFSMTWYRDDSTMRRHYVKHKLLFKLSAYEKMPSGQYRKIFATKRPVSFSDYQSLDRSISMELFHFIVGLTMMEDKSVSQDRWISRIQNRILSNPDEYVFIQDSREISIDSLNKSVRGDWVNFPAVAAPHLTPGIFNTFLDFRNGTAQRAPVQVAFNSADSLWKASLKDKRARIWGLCDGSDFYMRLTDTSFVKIVRDGDSYRFNLPHTVPDVHRILSAAQTRAELSPMYNAPAAKDPVTLLLEMVVLLGVGAIEEGAAKKRHKKMLYRDAQELYRTCYLNMDNGDIILDDGVWHKLDMAAFDSTVLSIYTQVGDLAAADDLFAIPEFVKLYALPGRVNQVATNYIARTDRVFEQKQIAIYLLQNLPVDDYASLLDSSIKLYLSGTISEQMLNVVLLPATHKKRAVAENYKDWRIKNLLKGLRKKETISPQLRVTIDGILSGEAIKAGSLAKFK